MCMYMCVSICTYICHVSICMYMCICNDMKVEDLYVERSVKGRESGEKRAIGKKDKYFRFSPISRT